MLSCVFLFNYSLKNQRERNSYTSVTVRLTLLPPFSNMFLLVEPIHSVMVPFAVMSSYLVGLFSLFRNPLQKLQTLVSFCVCGGVIWSLQSRTAEGQN